MGWFSVPRRFTLVLLGTGLLLGGAGCKKNPTKQMAPEAAQRMAAPSPAARVRPKEVVLTVGLRNPAKVVDHGLRLVQQFAPLPMTRESLLDLLAQQAHLPRDLLAMVNLEGTFWLLGLDEKALKESDPSLLVFPVKSGQAFREALEKRMKPVNREADLVTYEPRPGEVGLRKVALVIDEKLVLFPSSKAVMAASLAYARGTLTRLTPAHDLDVQVHVEELMRTQGEDIKRGLNRLVEEVNQEQRTQQTGAAAGLKPDDQALIKKAGDTEVRQLIDLLASARLFGLGLDISPRGLTVTAHGEGQAGGALETVIRRQRPGAPAGHELLPASSWLVFADHGNPEARKEKAGTWRPALEVLFRDRMDEATRGRFEAALSELLATATGDFTMAYHRALSGSGLCVSVISQVTDGKKAEAGFQKVLEVGSAWVEAMMAQEQKKGTIPKGFELQRTAFRHGDAKGALFKMTVALPPEQAEQAKLLHSLLGTPLVAGIAFLGDRLFAVLGKDAEAQLKALCAGKAGGLSEREAFKALTEPDRGRVGLVYLSLTDLWRWFDGTSVQTLLPEELRQIRLPETQTAITLSWGVDAKRTRLDAILTLPADHLLALKPLVDAALKAKAQLPAESLFSPPALAPAPTVAP